MHWNCFGQNWNKLHCKIYRLCLINFFSMLNPCRLVSDELQSVFLPSNKYFGHMHCRKTLILFIPLKRVIYKQTMPIQVEMHFHVIPGVCILLNWFVKHIKKQIPRCYLKNWFLWTLHLICNITGSCSLLTIGIMLWDKGSLTAVNPSCNHPTTPYSCLAFVEIVMSMFLIYL